MIQILTVNNVLYLIENGQYVAYKGGKTILTFVSAESVSISLKWTIGAHTVLGLHMARLHRHKYWLTA